MVKKLLLEENSGSFLRYSIRSKKIKLSIPIWHLASTVHLLFLLVFSNNPIKQVFFFFFLLFYTREKGGSGRGRFVWTSTQEIHDGAGLRIQSGCYSSQGEYSLQSCFQEPIPGTSFQGPGLSPEPRALLALSYFSGSQSCPTFSLNQPGAPRPSSRKISWEGPPPCGQTTSPP